MNTTTSNILGTKKIHVSRTIIRTSFLRLVFICYKAFGFLKLAHLSPRHCITSAHLFFHFLHPFLVHTFLRLIILYVPHMPLCYANTYVTMPLHFLII
jgi:hypothetical protein